MLIHKNEFATFQFEKDLLMIMLENKEPTDEEWNFCKTHILSYYEANIENRKMFSIICDLSRMDALPVFRIMDWAKFFLKNKQLTKQCVKCTAFITENKIILSSMNMFFKIYTSVRPTHLVSNMEDAKKWIDTQKID